MRACKLAFAAGLLVGCGGPDQPTTHSPTATDDAPEFRQATQRAERIAKEQRDAERKSLGRRTSEETEIENR